MADTNKRKGYVSCIDDTDYFVSVTGSVINMKGEQLKPQYKNGYNMVWLKRKQCYVHILVAKAYLSNPDNKGYVNHKDGQKRHNYVMNVEWSTPGENNKHAYDTGLREPANVATHTLVSPSGEEVTFTNVSQFCRENLMARSGVNYVLSGKHKQCHGWRLPNGSYQV